MTEEANRRHMPQVTLHVVSGPYQGRSILLRQGETCRLGRSDPSDLVFGRDPHLAGVHFLLDCSADRTRLRDLGSQNGTYVNGERQLEVMIQNGDIIQAGQTQFQVRLEGDRPQPARAMKTPTAILSTDPSRPYARGCTDEDPLVRREALLAAAWTRRPWLLDYCRQLCAQPAPDHWEAIYLLAVIGEPSDLEQMLRLGRMTELGPQRFRVLGAFGHPGSVDELVVRIESKDTETAVAAGLAFTKITGIHIESDREVEITSSEEEDESATAANMMLPDPMAAAMHWRQHRSRFLSSPRCCRGFDVSHGASSEVLEALDMESRFEACLRDHFYGRRSGSPIELWSFLQ